MAPGRTKVCAGKKERGQRLLQSLWENAEKGEGRPQLTPRKSLLQHWGGVGGAGWRRGHLPSKGPDQTAVQGPPSPNGA